MGNQQRSLHDACSQYLSHHSGQPADQVLTLANLRRRERIGLLNPDRASTYDPTEFSARGVVSLRINLHIGPQ